MNIFFNEDEEVRDLATGATAVLTNATDGRLVSTLTFELVGGHIYNNTAVRCFDTLNLATEESSITIVMAGTVYTMYIIL